MINEYETINLDEFQVYYNTGNGYQVITVCDDICPYNILEYNELYQNENDIPESINKVQVCPNHNLKDEIEIKDNNNSVDIENQFILYPNPFDNYLRFESNLKNISIKIYNINSIETSDYEIIDNTIYFGNSCSSGIYFVVINSDNGTFTRKIIKQ